jgi:hypothetical protein
MLAYLAEGFSVVAACLFATIFTVMRGIIYFRKRTVKNLQMCLVSVLVFPLFFASFYLVAMLKVWSMPIPKIGIWDPMSNLSFNAVALSVVVAYVFAYWLTRLLIRISIVGN